MEKEKKTYRALQKHLNAGTMGYPSVSSGADIRILEFLFTPEEARFALLLDAHGRTLDEIENLIPAGRPPREKLRELFDGMAGKGSIERLERGTASLYRALPLIVGMWEGQACRLTPEFVKDFRDYTMSNPYGMSFLATKLPQMRTIPVGKSVTPEHAVQTYDELNLLVDGSEGPFVLFDCVCRNARTLEGKACKKTQRTETCIAFGDMARYIHGSGNGRLVDKDAVRAVLAQNQEDGLVLQPSNTRKAEFVCSCCGCCCGMLSWHHEVPRPVNFWASNYFAAVDAEKCTACGLCAKRCQVKGVTLNAKKKTAAVNRNRCIGCGVCVPSCKAGAIRLEKKPRETAPPADFDELNRIILDNRKGALGTLGVVRKMLFRES